MSRDDVATAFEQADPFILDSTQEKEGKSEKTERSEKTGKTGKEGKSISQGLVSLVLDQNIELFHFGDEPYVTLRINGHNETWKIRSRPFRTWISKLYFEQFQKPPGNQGVQDVLNVLEGQALHNGREEEVFVRLAGNKQKIFVDLCDPEWRVIEIDENGYQVIGSSECPFRFIRASGMRPLPLPEPGSSLDEVSQFLNIQITDLVLVQAWLLMVFRPTGPYPVLILNGEAGSAKTTATRILRSLTDPNLADTRTAPRTEQDLLLAAKNGRVITLENLSSIPDWLSDALCRISTGAGFGTRTLFTNDEETLIQVCRPAVLNGINPLATRGDLVDRSLSVTLDPILEEKRKTEAEFWESFEKARPRIFGAVLDRVSEAIRNLPGVLLPTKPRMADFTQWAVASGLDGFLERYVTVRKDEFINLIEGHAVGRALTKFIEEQGEWTGTASELLKLLSKRTEDIEKEGKEWPKQPNQLSKCLRRLAPALRGIGIDVTETRNHEGRFFTLRKAKENIDTTVTTDTLQAYRRSPRDDDPPSTVTGKGG